MHTGHRMVNGCPQTRCPRQLLASPLPLLPWGPMACTPGSAQLPCAFSSFGYVAHFAAQSAGARHLAIVLVALILHTAWNLRIIQTSLRVLPACSGSNNDRSVFCSLACITMHGVQQSSFASTSSVLTRFGMANALSVTAVHDVMLPGMHIKHAML